MPSTASWRGSLVPPLLAVTLGLSLAPGLVSCGKNDKGSTPDTATGGAGGGTGGAAATGGSTAGGSDAPGGSDVGTDTRACSIPCLAAISDDCVPRGACTADIIGVTGTICYENGVKVVTGIVRADPVTSGMSYKKIDGSACFSIETTGNLAAMEAMLTYKDAAGATVATAVYDASIKKFILTCDGANHVLSSSSGCATPLTGLGGVPTASSPTNCPTGPCR